LLPPTNSPFASVALDARGQAHVAIDAHNATTRLADILFASRTGTGWGVRRVEGVNLWSRGPTLAIGPDNVPRVAYGVSQFNYTVILRYAAFEGGSWSFTDLSRGLTGNQPPDLAVDSLGRPYVVGGTKNGVEVFVRTPLGWVREVTGTDLAVNVVIDLNRAGEPRTAYVREKPGNLTLTYDRRTPSGWESEKVLSVPGEGSVQLRVDETDTPHIIYYDIARNVIVYAVRRPCVSGNRAPVADSGGPYSGQEGGPIAFSAASSTDHDGDSLQFRWDFNGDGAWDTDWSPNATASYTWGDDYSGTVRVEVTDGELNDTAQTSIKVTNVSPVVTNFTIAPANPGCSDTGDEDGSHDGEHEHEDHGCGDRDDDCHDDDRDEGCKDHDDEGGCGDRDDGHEHDGRDHEEHDHDDDEGKGCGATFTFRATAHDPGSDDLTFFWDFGDGSNASHTYYNNGVSPDPYPSPGPTFPVNLTNETTHTYTTSGNFTVTLTVSDDDHGNVTIVRHVLVCGGGGDEHGDHDGEHEHDEGCGGGDEEDRDHGKVQGNEVRLPGPEPDEVAGGARWEDARVALRDCREILARP